MSMRIPRCIISGIPGALYINIEEYPLKKKCCLNDSIQKLTGYRSEKLNCGNVDNVPYY